MALIYTGTTGLFTQLGKLVKQYEQFKEDANDASSGLDADRDEILDAFQADDKDVLIDGLVSEYERWKEEYVDRRQSLYEYVVARLLDQRTVLDELGLSQQSVEEVLSALIADMEDNSQSVKASTVSIGSVTSSAGNAGGGVILVTDELDGATSPGSVNGVPMSAQRLYAGKTTELTAPAESFRLQVVSDAFEDGAGEGFEEIEWQGMSTDQQHGIKEDGTGHVGTIQPLHAVSESYLTNTDMEDFTSDVPDHWTVVSGTAGTHINQATGSFKHGSSSLKFNGDGSLSAIEIQQAIASAVNSNRKYCLSAQLRGVNTVTGTVTVSLEGTGYTPGASEKISVSASSLGAFELKHCFVTLPAVVPSDLKVVLRWDGGTPGSSEAVYIDDIGFGPVNYGGGVGLVAIRDSGPFVKGDKFQFSVTNTEGVFQSFFRRAFGVQLPSAPSPTIADSLAQ
jgi:hypothetical protein